MAVDWGELHGAHETIALLLDRHFSIFILDLEYGSEVSNKYFIFVDHEVVWFNVSVNTFQFVYLLNAVNHLNGHISDSIVVILAVLMLSLDIII